MLLTAIGNFWRMVLKGLAAIKTAFNSSTGITNDLYYWG